MSTQPSSNPNTGGMSELQINAVQPEQSGAVPRTQPRVFNPVAELRGQLKQLRTKLARLERDLDELVYPAADVTPERISAAVAHEWGVRSERLFHRSHATHINLPRRASQFLMRKHAKLSLPEIGRIFGQHHTTVMHSLNVFKDFYDQDAVLRARVRCVEESLGVQP